ncbi:MAG: hypothetical protein U0271_11660 [Polyangiaceae bacterium]
MTTCLIRLVLGSGGALAISAVVALTGCGSEVSTGGAGGQGGNGGGDSCSIFHGAEEPVELVNLTVVNHSANPIYLGDTQQGCGTPLLYSAETLSGDPVKTVMQACELTCSDLAQSSCGCAADCAIPTVIMILPNGSYSMTWARSVFEPTSMPLACYADPDCYSDTCLEGKDATAALRFSVAAYPELGDCSQAICDCDPGTVGSCVVDGATIVGGAPVSASTDWSPGDPDIVITVQ